MSVNFYDLCRVCTANSENKINVFSAEGRRRNLNFKVAVCLDLQIEEGEVDRLPKVLCAQCVRHVESNMDFRNLCKNSQTTLIGWLNSATDGKTYVKNEISPGVWAFDVENTVEKQQPLQQYTITIDNKLPKTVTLQNNKIQRQKQTQINVKDSKSNALEEFLKLKPNIKVTPIKKEPRNPQPQPITQSTLTQQPPSISTQPETQTTPELQQQITSLQLQKILQQQIQQQWQQQQFQNQLQQLAQLQPQQITITAPTVPTVTAAGTAVNVSNVSNVSLSPSKSKKPKINFLFTPTPQTTQQTATMLPQLSTTSAVTPSINSQQSQIQLQIQPTLTQSIQSQQQQQLEFQHQQPLQADTTNLLSNLTPFLQQAIGATTSMGTSSATALLSPNKCFLPITIKDENSDQQVVAHIDAKNFVFPTTYQLQMKLQPQIATVDGKPIMQLTPTSIPATLQLTPQAITNQTFQALFTAPQQSQHQTQPQLQQHQNQNQTQQQQTVSQTSQTPRPQPNSQPLITSQQIIRPANNANSFIVKNISNEDVISSNQQQEADIKTKTQIISQPKYKITQLPGNTIEIKPHTDFATTQQQQQQQQQQQISTLPSTLSNSEPTQYGGITVQRISVPSSKGPTDIKIVQQQQKNQIYTESLPPTVCTVNNVAKLSHWNKQNVTISRVPAQTSSLQQHQQQKPTEKKVCTQSQSNNNQLQKEVNNEQATTSKKAEKKTIRRALSAKLAAVNKTPQQQQQQSQQLKVPKPSLEPTELSLSSGITLKTVKKTSSTSETTTTKLTNKSSNPSAHQTSPDNADSASGATNQNATSGFVCNQCQRVFKKKEHLTQHVKLHAGIRPFKCTQDGCVKDFSRKEHLLRHLISHTGQKMFSCEVCQKLFSRKDNLNKHKRIHSTSQNSSIYSCGICNKSFTVKALYQEHMAMHKKEEPILDTQKKNHIGSTAQSNSEVVQLSESGVVNTTSGTQTDLNEAPPQQLHQQQIMHLQLPTVVTTQDLAGNTITITQSSESNNKAIANHSSGVLNLPSHFGNFVQIGQTQYINSSTGQFLGHIKIEK